MPERGFLSGYKTYITAGMSIIVASAAFAVGEPIFDQEVFTIAEWFQIVSTALIAAFLRHGVATNSGG